jgi:putative zinc finger protein
MMPHLDPEILAAWLDGSLDGPERERAEAHAADCDRCRAVLAAMVRTEPPPARSWFQLPAVRWLVPLATAALVVLVWQVSVERSQPAKPQVRAQRSVASTPPPAAPPAATPQPVPVPPASAVSDARIRQTPRTDRFAGREEKHAREAPVASAQPAPPVGALAETVTLQSPPPATQSAARVMREAPALRDVASPDPLVRWRFGAQGLIQRSIDGGKTWTLVVFPEKADITALTAPGAQTATVTLADGRRFTTTDAGKTWTIDK